MKYENIPTNLVIGFLGVGKTTAIRHLLNQVPQGERWGVLVNEFGEVGIDGAFLEADGVAIQEVPGGCLCCVASSGLTVGLNQLIRDSNPHRILIEPTGLGHPAQILNNLSEPPFDRVLTVGATIGLVDARQLNDRRYRDHPTYQDQIHLADVLVATKADLYSETDHRLFEQLAGTLAPAKNHLATVEHGKLDKSWLDLPRTAQRRALFPEAHKFLQETQPHEHTHDHDHGDKLSKDWLKIENAGDGFYSCGWMINRNQIFVYDDLIELLKGIGAERAKGVLHTEAGWRTLNLTIGEQDIQDSEERSDNRLEILHPHPLDWQEIDQRLAEARVKP